MLTMKILFTVLGMLWTVFLWFSVNMYAEVKDSKERIIVLETNYKNILNLLVDIKQAVKDDRATKA